MSFLRDCEIDDVLRWSVVTSDPTANSAAADATGNVVYRVYEDGTYMSSPAQTGNMTLTDSANTEGFYSAAITLSAANGYEENKNYTIHIAATVGGVAVATKYDFRIVPPRPKRSDVNPIAYGTAQSASASGLVLAAGESFADNELTGQVVTVVSASTGAKQSRIITGNVGSTDAITIFPAWTTTPTGTIVYRIDPGPAHVASADATLLLSDADWQQVRYRLGIDGTPAAPSTANPNLGQVTCEKITVIAAGNDNAVTLSGSGTGHGLAATGGATGKGARLAGGVTSGDGLEVIAQAATYAGLKATGVGTGAGIAATGGASGAGVSATGGGAAAGVSVTGGATGDGVSIVGQGPGAGLFVDGGSSGGHGIHTSGSGSGAGLRADGGSAGGKGIWAQGLTSGAGISAEGGPTGVGFRAKGGATSGAGAVFEATAGNSDGLTLTKQGTGLPVSPELDVDAVSLAGSANAAKRLAAGALAIIGFTVNDVSATATTAVLAAKDGSTLPPTIGTWTRRIYFVTGPLAGQERALTAFNNGTSEATFDAFPAAPGNGDEGVIA